MHALLVISFSDILFFYSGALGHLSGLNLNNNPLVFPPKKVIESGTKVSDECYCFCNIEIDLSTKSLKNLYRMKSLGMKLKFFTQRGYNIKSGYFNIGFSEDLFVRSCWKQFLLLDSVRRSYLHQILLELRENMIRLNIRFP